MLDPEYSFHKKNFRKNICDEEKRFIWCCQNGEAPSESELELLQEPSNDTGETLELTEVFHIAPFEID